ncbi:MAG: hypothetical protein WB780_20290 [Candidatus Acidiferrales bacterium]
MKRLLFALAFLLFAFPLYAVNAGDITAGWVCGASEASDIRLNGYVLDLRIFATGAASFTLGIDSSFPSNPPYNSTNSAKLVLSMTSPSFNAAGGATTVTRLDYGTQWVRQTYPTQTTPDIIAAGSADACSGDTVPAGYADVRVSLSDPVYAADTSVTLNAASSAITLGGQANNAVSGLSIINNSSTSINACSNVVGYPGACSASKYPLPVARWGTVPYQDVTGSSFLVDVVASSHYFPVFAPIAAVIVSGSDAHSHTFSYTLNNPVISGTTPGDQGTLQAYEANISLAGLTATDTITVNFKVCPTIGDTCLDSSSLSGSIVTATLGAGGVGYAVGDTGTITGSSCAVPGSYKVHTLSVTAVVTFYLTYGGNNCTTTATAATTDAGAQPGVGSGFTVNTSVLRGLAGNEDVGPLVFLNCDGSTSGVCANPAAVVDPASTAASAAVADTIADAETAYGGNVNTAYVNTQTAEAACKVYNNAHNSHNDPGSCHLRLVTANHTIGSNGSDLTAQKDWLVVEPYTGGSPVIIAGVNSSAHVQLIEYNGVAVNDAVGPCSGSSCYVFVGSSTDRLWLNNVNPLSNGTGGAIYSWYAAYATNNKVTAINSHGFSYFSTTRSPWPLIRGNIFPISTNSVCDMYAVFANLNCYPKPHEQSLTTNGAVNANSQALSDGIVFAFNKLYGATQVFSAGTMYWSGTNSVMNYGCALIENVLEQTNSSGPLFGISADATNSPTQNCDVWDNTAVGERTNIFYNDGSDSGDSSFNNWFAQTNESLVGNIFAYRATKTDTFSSHYNGARTGNWAPHYGVGSYGNWEFNCGGINPCTEGPVSWMGMFDGLNANYNGVQVLGTDSNQYVANATCTAASGNKPVTGGSYTACWTAQGHAGDSSTTWTTGSIYQPPGFISDRSYSTGTAAGSGNYHLTSISGAIGLGTGNPLPYDIEGHPRVGRSVAGAYTFGTSRRGYR